MGALLGELSDLARDMTILKAAPDGGSALLTGLYDRKTLSELGGELPMSRFLYLTDTLRQCCAALPDSIRPRTDAELCLLKLCDETLSGDLTALCQRVAALEKGGVPQAAPPPRKASRPAAETRPAPVRDIPIETRYDEAPPPPEEYGERVFDIPAEAPPRPVRKAAPAASPAPQAAAAGDPEVWTRLIDQYKGRLSVKDRVFLNMASGVVADGCLTVLCQNDFVKDSLNSETVLSVLREVTARELGQPIRIQLTVGSAPKAAAKPASGAARAPRSTPPVSAAPPAVPGEAPPWEEPKKTDVLDELAAKGQQLEHFKIK